MKYTNYNRIIILKNLKSNYFIKIVLGFTSGEYFSILDLYLKIFINKLFLYFEVI